MTPEETALLASLPKPSKKPAGRPRKEKERKTYTPKDKARYAIEKRGGELWMQKWIDWDDTSIPIGKRRVAYVRYLTMTQGYSIDKAKLQSKRVIRY